MNNKIAIFDFDGTLALVDHRIHFIERNHIDNEMRCVEIHCVRPDGENCEYDERSKMYDDRKFRKECPNQFKPDWDAFYEACDKDLPNKNIIELFKVLKKSGYYMIIFSGRSDAVSVKSMKWLLDNGIIADEIRFRPSESRELDHDLKLNWLNDLIKSGIILKSEITVFDDRDTVVKMWRDQGITCLQVAQGNF